MTTQPTHPSAPEEGNGRLKVLIALVVIGILVVTIGLAGFALFLRSRADSPSVAEIQETAEPTQVTTFDVNGVQVPVYPDAVSDPTSGPTSMVASNTSVDQVIQWYQTMLPAAGFTVQAVNEGQVTTDFSGQSFEVTVVDTGEGQAVITVLPANQMAAEPPPQLIPENVDVVTQPVSFQPEVETLAQPVAVEAEVAAQVEVAEAAISETAMTSNDALPAEAADDFQGESPNDIQTASPSDTPLDVSVQVSPTSIYGGTWNRPTYTLAVTGNGTVTVTATLPEGILVHPDDLGALGINYDSGTRVLTWQPNLANGSAQATFEAVNDVLAPPDSLVMKVVAQTGNSDQQPVIQVATLDIESY